MDLQEITALINDIKTKQDLEKVINILKSTDNHQYNKILDSLIKAKEGSLDIKDVFRVIDELNWQSLNDNVKSNEQQYSISFEIPKDSDRELIKDFIIESRENIQNAEEAIIKLESNPNDKESINKVFRCFHTIKGTSSFIGLSFISEFSHHVENLLSKIREGKIPFTKKLGDISLKSIDVVKFLLDDIERIISDENNNYTVKKPDGYDYIIEKIKKADDLIKDEKVETIQNENKIDDNQFNKNYDEQSEDKTIRVKIEKLDRLIDTIGEMSITFSMIFQKIEESKNHEMIKKAHQLEKIVRELQELGMSLRMVPIKNMFNKMQRLARDLSRKMNKEIILKVSGEDTEIDRNMINSVEEMLVHMLRNSIDHGIESKEERINKGKDPKGTINLRAYNADGNVIFEIEDDGRGLNKEKILKKAIEKNLIDPNIQLNENDIYDLIFLPGFSTAEKISDISGRGVGMDVVKKGVEALRGKIEIKTQEGKFTLFRLKFPLTMAVTDGMLVKVDDDIYVIPVNAVNILAKKEEGKLYSINSKDEVFHLRGEVLPVFRMRKIFSKENKNIDGIFVIVKDKERKIALMVDDVIGKQQVVAKPLTGIKNFPGILGGCILGDGRVAVIIDPQGIIKFYKENFKKENVFVTSNV
ncbi:MAG: chemotaxis protein CheA [Elusimicrobiales bacterium]|nr:chemotaxis protein CheA [Elusimicrobiales bacterium]